MATATTQTPEQTLAQDLSGLQLYRFQLTNIAQPDTFSPNVGPIAAAALGDLGGVMTVTVNGADPTMVDIIPAVAGQGGTLYVWAPR